MLKMSGVHTYYGESHILQGIALAVGPAQCVALLGRNGAGKTTTLRSILGLTPARRGQIIFKGTDITGLATHQIVRSGIAFVPEDRGIFLTVTVQEHLAIAYGASKHRPTRKPIEHVLGIFPRLAERRHSLGGQLSGGEQQMLAIGRALVTGPDLMILDEPSEGLAPVIIETLEEVLKNVKMAGIPILLVEQNYHLAMRLADYVYVLSQGRVQFSGETQALIANEEIRRTYLSV
jgi:branched-chain amino acid transport system ATP-binding protein